MSISWGPWSRIGAVHELAERGVHAGVAMIEPADGLEFFARLMRSGGTADACIAALDLTLAELPPRLRKLPLLTELFAAAEVPADGQAGSCFLDQYAATPAAARRPLLLAHVQRLVAGALGISRPCSIRPDEAFFDLGLESLSSLEVRNQIQTTLQIDVPSTILFDYPTPDALVNRLGQLIGTNDSSAPDPSEAQLPGAAVESRTLERSTGASMPADCVAQGNGSAGEAGELVEAVLKLSDDLASWADNVEETDV